LCCGDRWYGRIIGRNNPSQGTPKYTKDSKKGLNTGYVLRGSLVRGNYRKKKQNQGTTKYTKDSKRRIEHGPFAAGVDDAGELLEEINPDMGRMEKTNHGDPEARR
jgi:hypothetical protein